MKATYCEITTEMIGYNGVDDEDVGRYLVHCLHSNVFYYRDCEHEARQLVNYLNEA